MKILPLATTACLLLATALYAEEATVRIGSKSFTENFILAQMVKQLVQEEGDEVIHRELGGTQIVWSALLAGEIDVYPEYTGTLVQEVLSREAPKSEEEVHRLLAERGVVMSAPIGFSNTYLIGMRRKMAERLGITKVSDLADHPSLKLGFSNEFLDRDDGWPGLRRHYNLPQQDVRGLEHDLAYAALDRSQIDVTDFYSTDGKLAGYDFVGLEDDRKYFPDYDAVLLYRKDLKERAPQAVASFLRLVGTIDEATMIQLNARAEVDSVQPAVVAADFLRQEFAMDVTVENASFWTRLRRNTIGHLQLVLISLALGILFAVPLGVLAAKWHRGGQVILAGVGLVQTIPSIVLLVLLIPLLGVGESPAIFALFVYSLLPIVRNSHAGLHDIAPGLVESAEAIGLGSWSRLWRIELPLASRSILAGIKTAAVINVGTATLGGFIGAGGFGQPIFQGLRSSNWEFMIWQGAVPTAILSLVVLGIFEIAERFCVPKGLRLKPVTN